MRSRIHGFLAGILCLAAVAGADPYKDIESYKLGQSRVNLAAIEQEIRTSKPEGYAAIEDKLLGLLESTAATVDCKIFVCRVMGRVGSAKSVPAVAALLSDEKVSHMARQALVAIPDASAGKALCDALGKVKGNLLAGVIGSLGQRREAAAVEMLGKLLGDSDAAVAASAAEALAKIANADAAKALQGARGTAAESLRMVVDDGLLACAAEMIKSGNAAQATAILQPLVDAQNPTAVRYAAKFAMIRSASADEAGKLILEAVESQDAAARLAAIVAIREVSTPAVRNVLGEKLSGLSVAAQVAVLPLLSEAGDVKLRPALVAILSSSQDAALRAIALEAMGRYAESQDIPMLVQLAGKDSDNESAAAKSALALVNVAGVDDELVKLAKAGERPVRLVAIRSLGARNVEGTLDLFKTLLEEKDTVVRNEAIKAIGDGGAVAQLTLLVDYLGRCDAGAQGPTEAAIKNIVSRATTETSATKPDCSAILVPAMEAAKASAIRAVLLRSLSRVGDEPSLAAVSKFLSDSDKDVSDAAIRSLSDWTDKAAAPALLTVAQAGDSQVHQILALRGYVRLSGVRGVSPAERVEMCRKAFAAAKRPDEQRLVLGALADAEDFKAWEPIKSCLKDAALSKEAALAGIRLAENLKAKNERKPAGTILQQLKAEVSDAGLQKQIDQAIANLNKPVKKRK